MTRIRDWRYAIRDTLDALGLDEVVSVATGAGAVNALVGTPQGFSVAIVDIFLSDMTAKSMVKHFPEKHGIKSVILYSGGRADDFSAVHSAFKGLGISDIHYLRKPATVEQFQELLN